MKERESHRQPFSEEFFYVIAGSTSAWLLYRLFAPKVIHWWETHTFTIVGIAVVLVTSCTILVAAKLWNHYVDHHYKKAVIAERSDTVYVGRDPGGKRYHVGQKARTEHTQLIGTTGAGKTESVILPWAISDIKRGDSVIIVDGKAERSFVDKLYAHVKLAEREDEFFLFSLARVDISSTFNPLQGKNPKQIAERIFSGFSFENQYYRDIQYQVFEDCLTLVMEQRKTPTFILVERLLSDMTLLKSWLTHCKHTLVKHRLTSFSDLSDERRQQNVSGLLAQIGHFTSGETAKLFNCTTSGISLDEAIEKGYIICFELPTMYYPFLAKATGKLVLQMLQNIISQRHLGLLDKSHFLSIFLDDFQDYMYEDFGSLLNKPRSANTAILLSHNALGDLDKVSRAFRDIVTSCTNIKIVMKANDPDTADYLARYFGTETVEIKTERETSGALGKQKTGESSVRDGDQFIFHPNRIKALPTGVGIVKLPHLLGSIAAEIRFRRAEDLPKVSLPVIAKPEIDESELLPAPQKTQPSSDKIA